MSDNDDISEITTEPITDEQSQQNKPGYIYLFTNEMFQWYGENIYKIGKAQHILHRLKSYTTGYIDPLTLVFSSMLCKNYSVCEKEIHNRLNKYRMRTNRDFFQVAIQVAIEVIETTVNELNELDDEALFMYHDDIKIATRTNVHLREPDVQNIDINVFNEYVKTGQTIDEHLIHNLQLLNLQNETAETLNKYKTELTEKSKFKKHVNIIKCLESTESIEQKQDEQLIYRKIYQIIQLEKRMNIKRFQVDVKLADVVYYDILDNEYKLISKTFSIVRIKPTNADELFKLYIYVLRHLMSNDILIKTKGTLRKNNKITYKLNLELLQYHIGLNSHSNPSQLNYDKDVLIYII